MYPYNVYMTAQRWNGVQHKDVDEAQGEATGTILNVSAMYQLPRTCNVNTDCSPGVGLRVS